MSRKKINFRVLALMLFVLFSGSCSVAQQTPSDNGSSVLIDSIDQTENLLDSNLAYKQQFDSLSDEGDWIKVKKSDFLRDLSEGTGEEYEVNYYYDNEFIYIWKPFCATNTWNPYSEGRWVFSNYGWMWVSDYSWGWAPYNYGRWYFSNFYGWIWMPGNAWACNWVNWRGYGNYVGWYPTCPRLYWRDHRNQVCTNYTYAHVSANWIFQGQGNFTKKVTKNTIVSASETADILKNSTKIKSSVFVDPGKPNIKYNGPDVKVISKEAGVKITPKVVEVNDKKVKSYTDNEQNPMTIKNGTKTTEGNLNTNRENNSGTVKSNGNEKNTSPPNTKKGTPPKKKVQTKQQDDLKDYKGSSDNNTNSNNGNTGNDTTKGSDNGGSNSTVKSGSSDDKNNNTGVSKGSNEKTK